MGILIIIGRVLITALIVILSLFLLALLLAGLVLFVPVRYRLLVEKEAAEEGEGQFVDKLHVKGLISWCLFLVRLPFSFDNGEGKYQIRVLGIDIKRLRQKFPKRKKKEKGGKRNEKGKKFDKMGKNTDTNDLVAQEVEIEDNKSQDKKKIDDEDLGDKTVWQRIKSILKRIFNMPFVIWGHIKVIVNKIRKLPSNIRDKRKQAKEYIELLKSDMFKESICVVWENVVNLWSKLKPRYLSTKLHFGTSDPCLTGQILGVIAVFMGMTGYYIEVTPDFEEKVFEGRMEIKGRMQFVTLLKIIVRLYKDENIKKVVKQFDLF